MHELTALQELLDKYSNWAKDRDKVKNPQGDIPLMGLRTILITLKHAQEHGDFLKLYDQLWTLYLVEETGNTILRALYAEALTDVHYRMFLGVPYLLERKTVLG